MDLLYAVGYTPWERTLPAAEGMSIADKFGVPGQVLDIGCGSGNLCVYLAGRGWTVTGLDASTVAIHKTLRRAAAAGLTSKVAGIRGEIIKWKTAERFDLIIDIGCFVGVPDLAKYGYARKVRRLLRDGNSRVLLFTYAPKWVRGALVGMEAGDVEWIFSEAKLGVVDRTEGTWDGTATTWLVFAPNRSA